jgi:oligoribonuclease (3'-5' exoribonuclease)
MRYLSLDLETTGLDDTKCQILQVGAVFDDTCGPLETSPTFNALVWAPEYRGEAYALALNHEILSALAQNPFDRTIEFRGRKARVLHRQNLALQLNAWLSQYAPGPYVVAGKNAAGFDIPFLKKYPEFDLLNFDHRIIDVGSLYLRPGDARVPNLDECLRRGGFDTTVSHDAVDDALDVCKLIRRWELTYENNMVP